MKKEFTYPSADGKTQIHAISWVPEGKVRAVLQIAHGMVEFIDRYDRFAGVLNAEGILVVGNDHLGHGQSVTDPSNLGYFGSPDGNAFIIADIHQLRQQTEQQYPQVPFFLLGHSMGSFLARQYIEMYGQGLAGAIIMGTGYQTEGTLKAGKMLCKLIGSVRGWHYRSRFINNMAIGAYSKAFQPARTPADWLTRDEAVVDAYLHNPLCTFTFTVNGYYHLFRGLQYAEDPANLNKIPKDLPVLIVSGGKDPVGNFGKDPVKVAEIYKQTGLKDVTCKIYPEDRHEVLNEMDKETVDRDILEWIEQHMS